MSEIFYDSMKKELALVGFRYKSELKFFKTESYVTNPNFLGNAFTERIGSLINVLRSMDLEDEGIYSIHNSNFYKTKTKELEEKIKINDLSFINFRDNFRILYLPNAYSVEEMQSPNIDKYSWAYIYNFELKRLEFYGRHFIFKYLMPSSIKIPYYASLNINSIRIIRGLCNNCYDKRSGQINYCEFLKRNHEQEGMLYKLDLKE